MPLKLDLSLLNTSLTIRNFKLNEFDLDYQVADEAEIQFFSTIPGRILNKSNKFLIKKNLNPWHGIHLHGHWQSEEYFKDTKIKNIIKNSFRFKPLKSDKANQIKSQIDRQDRSVALHIRRGDYQGNWFFDVCTPDYYHRAMKSIRYKIDSPYFIIFSDDITYCKTLFNREKDIVFVEDCHSDVEELHLMTL